MTKELTGRVPMTCTDLAASARPCPPPARGWGLAAARTIIALILREMSTRYGRTPGGYIWAILEPMGTILILAAGFSMLVRAPALGHSFLLFYATGYLPFALYQGVALTVARALTFSRPLLLYPAVTWADALIARFVLNALTGVMVACLILAAILALSDTRSVLEIGPILTAFALAAGVGLGMGTLNCLLTGLFPAWEVIWSILTRPLFLASGALFLFESVPRAVQAVLWFNPLLHIAGIMRAGFYPMYHPGYVSVIYVVVFALSTLALGLVLLHRYHKDILTI